MSKYGTVSTVSIKGVITRRAWLRLRISAVIYLLCGLAAPSGGAKDTVQSDVPVTVEQAQKSCGIRLPLPSGARNVRYLLTGGTQDWNLYLSFEASLSEIEAAIKREVTSYRARNSAVGVFPAEDYPKAKLSDASNTGVSKYAPPWWGADKIRDGYFVGSRHPGGYGPHFWVNTKTGTVFYFEHF